MRMRDQAPVDGNGFSKRLVRLFTQRLRGPDVFEMWVQKVHPAPLESYEAAWPVIFIVKEHHRRKAVDRRPNHQGPKLGLAFWTKHMVCSHLGSCCSDVQWVLTRLKNR